MIKIIGNPTVLSYQINGMTRSPSTTQIVVSHFRASTQKKFMLSMVRYERRAEVSTYVTTRKIVTKAVVFNHE